MWTQKAWSTQPCLSSRGGDWVGGSKLQMSRRGLLLPEGNGKQWAGEALGVRAKVAVGSESGRQAPLLLSESNGEGKSAKSAAGGGVGCLELAPGRVENVDRSRTKVAKGRVVVIAGPTAAGKSRVAIALAKQLGGEIISADSIQVGFLRNPRYQIIVCGFMISTWRFRSKRTRCNTADAIPTK